MDPLAQDPEGAGSGGTEATSINPVPPPPRRGGFLQQTPWKAIVPAVTILGILATIYFSHIAASRQKIAEARDVDKEEAQANILLAAKPSNEPCEVWEKGVGSKTCRLAIEPTDERKHIVEFQIHYPAPGARFSHGTLGGSSITTSEAEDYLWTRAARQFGLTDKDTYVAPRTALVPILIATKFEFEGKIYEDRSFYFLVYLFSSIGKDRVIVPVNVSYCGRLKGTDPEMDFLIDPWLPTEVGFSEKESHTAWLSCNRDVGWIYVKRGRYEIETDTAQRIGNSPAINREHSFDLQGAKIRFRSLGAPIKTTYWLSKLG